MEGRGPFRIYDPGGGRKEEMTAAAFERLVEENAMLKEKMKGIKCLGELMEESQMQASKLRQKAEDLVKDNEVLKFSLSPDPFSPPQVQGASKPAEVAGCDQNLDSFVIPGENEKESPTAAKSDQKSPSSGSSSEFEVVPTSPESRKSDPDQRNEDGNLLLHLQRLENSLSIVAEKPDGSQLFAHLGRMALEFNRLASKVHKNEQRTSILQTLCEQLRKENEDLRRKLEQDLEQRNLANEKLRYESLELRRMLAMSGKEGVASVHHVPGKDEMVTVERARHQENVKPMEKPTCKDAGPAEKKVKALEHQRNELLEVNKQWDQHFRSMKQQYEQKITTLRKKLADSQKAATELEAEREQKQRDFDRKLLLAKSKIEAEEGAKEQLVAEVNDLKQKNKILQDQLTPVSRQREYQEKEIHRLNKALEEALNVQASVFGSPAETGAGLKRQELLTQMELLKQQVRIFEEDFQRERSDRERMNEEKEELKQQLEKFQSQMSLLSSQLRICKEDNQRDKEEKDKLRKLLKQHKQVLGERYPPEPYPVAHGPICPPYQFPYSPPTPHTVYPGFEDWQIRYPPTAVPAEHPQVADFRHFPLSEYQWRPPCPMPRNQTSQGAELARPHPMESDPTGLGVPKK